MEEGIVLGNSVEAASGALISFGVPNSIEDPLTPRWVVVRDGEPTLVGEAWRLEFDSEQELELSLAALGYERDGGEDAFGFRRWKRI